LVFLNFELELARPNAKNEEEREVHFAIRSILVYSAAYKAHTVPC
jgi:hypothetical protein